MAHGMCELGRMCDEVWGPQHVLKAGAGAVVGMRGRRGAGRKVLWATRDALPCVTGCEVPGCPAARGHGVVGQSGYGLPE